MKKYFVVIAAIFLLSCSKGDKIPDNVVKPDRMEKLLWDTFLAEAAAQQISAKDSTVVLSDKIKELTKKALQINKISETAFFRSYNWYVNHPETFSAVLDSLYNRKSAAAPIDQSPEKNTGSRKLKIEPAKSDSVAKQ